MSPLRSSLRLTTGSNGTAKSLLIFVLLFSWLSLLKAAELQPIVQAWLNAQTNLGTWKADVVQIRTLKTLLQPLTATGRVWFAAPGRFRWEIGRPARTIALRQPDQMLVIYPLLKRVEKYPMGDDSAGPWKDTLALLEAGFPRNAADLQGRFRVISQMPGSEAFQLTLEPKSAAARHMMPQIKIAFSTNDFTLRSTELQFTDGSTMRNDFSQPEINPVLPKDIFEPSIGVNYEIVEPLKK